MVLNDSDIQAFQEIYRREFGENLADDQARIMAEGLLRLYEVLAEPLPCEREGLAKCPECGIVWTTGPGTNSPHQSGPSSRPPSPTP